MTDAAVEFTYPYTPPVGDWGEGYANSAPQGLRVRMGIGAAGAMVDVSQYVRRETVRVDFSADTYQSVLQFDLDLPGGTMGGVAYDIHDWQEVRVDDTTLTNHAGGYLRYFGGFTQLVSWKVVGSSKVYTIRCGDYSLLLDRPPKQITTAYPNKDGTPVINTKMRQSISSVPATVSVTVEDPRNLYLNKMVWVANADGSNREYVQATAVGGRTFTATFNATKTYSTTTLTYDVTGGSAAQWVTVSSLTNVNVGTVVTLLNADGTYEDTSVLALDAGGHPLQFSAIVVGDKAAGATCEAIPRVSGGILDSSLIGTTGGDCWQQTSDNWVAVSTAVAGPGSVTVTLSDGKKCADYGITQGIRVYCSEDPALAGGLIVNPENVLVTAVTTYTFTATFTLAHAAGWHAAAYQSFDGFIADYLTAQGVTWNLSSVDTRGICKSIPHTVLENCTLREALTLVTGLTDDTGYLQTTSSTSVPSTPSGLRVITPASLVGITAHKTLTCANSNGTNVEDVWVQSIDTGAGTFSAVFRYAKTGTWNIFGGQSPRFGTSVVPDTNTHPDDWTPALLYFNAFETSYNTALALTDATTISDATQAHYDPQYQVDWDGSTRATRVTVSNPDTQASATYIDTAAETLLGRAIEAKPIVASSAKVITNDDAMVAAKNYVASFGKARNTLHSLITYAQLDPDIVRTQHVVSFTNSMGATAVYPVPRTTLSFEDGLAKYTFELGDRFSELGDKPTPLWGGGGTKDTTAPAIPQWPPDGGWIVGNTYDRNTDTSTLTVVWVSGNEPDLRRFVCNVSLDGWHWNNQFIVDYPASSLAINTHDVHTTGGEPADPGEPVWFEVYAEDASGNRSRESAIATTTFAARVPLQPPSNLTIAGQTPNGAQTIDVDLSWTASPGSTTIGYGIWAVQGNLIQHFPFAGRTTTTGTIQMEPGASGYLQIYAYDQWGQSARVPTYPPGLPIIVIPLPPSGDLRNPSFAILSRVDRTQAASWWGTAANGATGYVDTTSPQAIRGYNMYKMVLPVGGPPVASYDLLSDAVEVTDPSTADSPSLFQMFFRVGCVADYAYGTASVSVLWYSSADALLRTDTVGSGTPYTTTKYYIKRLQPPTNAVYYKVKLSGLGSAAHAVNMRFGAVTATPVVVGGQLPSEFDVDSEMNLVVGDSSTGQVIGGGGKAVLDADRGMAVQADGTWTPANYPLYDQAGDRMGLLAAVDDGAGNEKLSITTSTTDHMVNPGIEVVSAKGIAVAATGGDIVIDAEMGRQTIIKKGDGYGTDKAALEVRTSRVTGPAFRVTNISGSTVYFEVDCDGKIKEPFNPRYLQASFVSDGYLYYRATAAMALDTPAEEPGTATFSYDVALAATPTVFSSASFPLDLAVGDVLRVGTTGVVDYDTTIMQRTA